jgi:hypothetical protein
MYDSASLAAMVTERYPVVPFIREHTITIAEAVAAHFLGLNHVAVGGLIPVIEGAGRELAAQRGISNQSIKNTFKNLATDLKEDSAKNNIGAVGEIASMMEAFIGFTDQFFYQSSQSYPLLDNTNRHGILHGAYKDADYGTPINFYKTIAAVDFLCFISSFRAHISWLGPNTTPRSLELSMHYEFLKAVGVQRRAKQSYPP